MRSISTMDIYKASAGSGKTFSLTLHYIELVLQAPTNYRRILAVTFTNKATAEMKERILHVLQGLATNSDEVAQYRAILLDRMPQITAVDLQGKAHEVYTAILHDYSRFSVSTIDSFVQRIIRSFAWELGIDGGFKLQLSVDPVKEDLADRLYMRLDDDKDLQQWVIEMARARLEDGKRWEFREDMLNLSSELFKEKFSAFEMALTNRSKEEIQQAFLNLNHQVNAAVKEIEKKWKEAGQEILQLLQLHNLQKEDFHYGKGGFINYFFKASFGTPVELSGRVNDAIAQPEKMAAGKSAAETKATIAAISNILVSSLIKMRDWYESDVEQYETAQAIKQNVGVLRLMRVFAEELAAYRKDNNALLISDTHNLLRKLTEDTSASFIYEKTGNRYQHYLIDEFQDTSGFQWENFLPLLTEALAQGNYNLLVGDVKQAIYRWRNGDWRLLLNVAQQKLASLKPNVKSLQGNYLSAKAIIQFNNLLFHIAPQLLQNELNASIAQASMDTQNELLQKGYETVFNDAYADSFQLMPATANDNGVVSIQFIPDKDDSGESVDYDGIVLMQLYEKIQELFAAGYAAKDIAVLARTNSEAKAVVEFLIESQQPNHVSFKVISGDALLLASSQVIQMIVCAMRWVNDGRNTLALAQLRQLVLLQQGKDPNSLNVFESKGSNNMLPPRFVHDIDTLRTLPLIELLHQLVMMFGWHLDRKHQAYLLAFYDKVQEWTRYGEASLQEFLQYWDDEGLNASLPATSGVDAIEVVTVHKSKGLAYNIVLMPFLDWGIVPKGGPMAPILWADNSETAFNQIPVVPVKYKSALAKSAFAIDYYEEFLLAAMDNLNILYVAFTRAKQRLYGWAPLKTAKPKSGDFPFSHIGSLIHAVASSTMQLPGNEYEDTRAAFEQDALLWKYGQPANNTAATTQQHAAPHYEQVYSDWRNRLQVKFQVLSNDESGEVVLPRKQGILLHEILGRMQNPVQLSDILTAVQQEGWMDEQQYKKVKEILEEVLAMDALQPWKSGKYKRLAERNIINIKRQLRRPDLVLYNINETIVYDFKFTATDTDIEKHKKQIGEYMTMLEQMGFAEVKGIVIYGLEKKALSV